MPFKSKKQQRFMFATMPHTAKKWAKETDFEDLPNKAKKTVRKHMRKRKNGVSVVKQHFRSVVKSFKKKHGVTSPVSLDFKKESKGTSMGYTDSFLKNGKPEKHEIKLEPKKIVAEGENPKEILKHELGHVLSREKQMVKTKEGKRIIKKERKKLKGATKYEKDKEEILARHLSKKV